MMSFLEKTPITPACKLLVTISSKVATSELKVYNSILSYPFRIHFQMFSNSF